ncbi:MAG: CDP-alcohol phosphatidyltransferase family protein [Coriobacteriia bacterium]|nr:CDP-alcohol phosphatidyltransferase family protein [Coriobacteriia bacterium]
MNTQDNRTQEILTVPNVITIVRLILVPVAFTVLVATTENKLAFVLFAVAAASDFVDGYIARLTGTESELGSMLDPLVDRLLLLCGVGGLYLLGRLPLWIVVGLIARDVYLLYGSARLRAMGIERVRILYIGKIATTALYIGFSGLILNWPLAQGLGWTDISWLPGFNAKEYCIWIWVVYIGFTLSMITMIWYRAIALVKKHNHDFESKTLPDPINMAKRGGD